MKPGETKRLHARVFELEKTIHRLEVELTLRTADLTFLVEIPKRHRVHGQGTAFQCGVESAYRKGRLPKRNPYTPGTAQHGAWETGWCMGAEKYIKDYAAALKVWE